MKALLAALPLLALACAGAANDADLAEKLGAGLHAACPPAPAGDEVARHQCAADLTDFILFRDSMNDPFFWGGQQAAGDWRLESHVTRFNPRVFRRMYLSLYSFPKEHTVEQLADGTTLLHVKAAFRNKLEMGSYPYPFWHKPSKWQSYQLATDVTFIIRGKRVLGALRNFVEDLSLPVVAHEFGGQWEWRSGGQLQPFVTLYSYIFSKDNPYVRELEVAFRDAEAAMRKQNCFICHSPENGPQMAELELFNYPNQALSARHRIVQTLEKNEMPTDDAIRGTVKGISDPVKRAELIELAKRFAAHGDLAMKWEGEQ